MALSFAELRKSRDSEFEKLQKEAEKLNSKGSYGDDRYWQPTVDQSGNGFAVIRFLSAPPKEDVAFVRMFSHGFKGPTGQWYIENSLTTLGQPDPASDFNSKLWNEVEDDNSPQRKQVRNQKRKLNYISNILVIDDPGNPENNGKVFLYKYGKKIWDKIHGAMYPEFQDEQAINPFDMWEGANFKLKVRKVEGYRNYDKSEFESPSPIFEDKDDSRYEKIWNSQHSLQEEISEDKFKSYEELEARLRLVLGAQYDQYSAPKQNSTYEPPASYTPPASAKAAEQREAPTASDDDLPWSNEDGSTGEDDDPMALFERMSK